MVFDIVYMSHVNKNLREYIRNCSKLSLLWKLETWYYKGKNVTYLQLLESLYGFLKYI